MAEDLISTKTEESPLAISKKNISEDQYKANPTQYVYDQTHQLDFVINVVDIFFARQIKKEEWKQGTGSYTVKNGGTIQAVLKKFEANNRRNIRTEPEKDPSTSVSKDEKINVVWEEKTIKTEMEKIHSAYIGDEVFLVASCTGNDVRLKIEIYENLIQQQEAIYASPFKFIETKNEKTSIEFTITKDKNLYFKKIELRAKDKEEYENNSKKLGETQTKKTNLYLKAEIVEKKESDRVTFNNTLSLITETQTDYMRKEQLFELKYCPCYIYYFEGDKFYGPNVIHTKSGNNVKAKGAIHTVTAIILHRTAGWDTAGAIDKTIGTHFFVDTDTHNTNFPNKSNINGEIFQPVELSQHTNHIYNSKPPRTSHLEIQTENSIGIEVAGMVYNYDSGGILRAYSSDMSSKTVTLTKGYEGTDKKTYYWDALTEAQIKSTACLVKKLMQRYSLTLDDIYVHEEIQSKTPGEGGAVKEAIWPYLTK